MFKKFLTSMLSFALLIFLVGTAQASGKMEVRLGEKVVLQSEALTVGGDHKWVVKKDRDIVSTQTGTIFTYTFDLQGEYDINLTVSDRSGATKSTSVEVMVGNRYSQVGGASGGVDGSTDSSGLNSPLRVYSETMPTTTSDQNVHIIGDEGRVVFDVATGNNILEYRIDRNIFVDSDGDGIANNDIDNADHNSYLLGGIWHTTYKASESNKIVAEVTVVDSSGQKARSQVEVIFASVPSKDAKVVAILDTLPSLDKEKNEITLYGDEDTLVFYPRRSQGDIVEYRIDKNIFVDSDNDGDPANDIDNRTDKSFKTGDVWFTDYVDNGQQIIAQLIVVGSNGKGSRIQREVHFSDAPAPVYYEETVASQGEDVIQLKADKDFVQKGDPVALSVEGLSQSLDNYVFDWDFNGDDEVDQSVEGLNTVSYIYDVAAIYPVKVLVSDKDGNTANFTMDLLVKDIAATTADFEVNVNGNAVSFTNLSQVAMNLSNKLLDYTWSFGDTDSDNYDSQRGQLGVENPNYVYTKPGTYIVTLTVVDSDQVTDTKTMEVVIGEDAFAAATGEDVKGEEPAKVKSEGGSIFGTILKVILYIILIVLVLIVLMIGGLLGFLKIQHPDLVFEELIDEMKIKLLSMMGVHEMVEPTADSSASAATEMPVAEPAKEEASEEEAPVSEGGYEEGESTVEGPVEDLSQPDAPMPDWMKPASEQAPATEAEVTEPEPEEKPAVIEGEVIEDSAEPAPEPAPVEPAPEVVEPEGEPVEGEDDLSKTDGPMPDWMKNQ